MCTVAVATSLTNRVLEEILEATTTNRGQVNLNYRPRHAGTFWEEKGQHQKGFVRLTPRISLEHTWTYPAHIYRGILDSPSLPTKIKQTGAVKRRAVELWGRQPGLQPQETRSCSPQNHRETRLSGRKSVHPKSVPLVSLPVSNCRSHVRKAP